MAGRSHDLLLVVGALLLIAPAASANEVGTLADEGDVAAESEPPNLTLVTKPARVAQAVVTAMTWAGYDGAAGNPRVGASIETRLLRRLALAVGVDSSSDGEGELRLRPQVTLRYQLLGQEASSIDATASVTYRQDRFEVDGGFLQSTVAVGRRFERLVTVLNLTFGIDPEGDDFEGEVRAAALVEVLRGFYLGVDAQYRHDLGSTDPLRKERGRSDAEALVAATTAYVRGRWAVMAEAGLSSVTTASTSTGPVALAGVSATF